MLGAVLGSSNDVSGSFACSRVIVLRAGSRDPAEGGEAPCGHPPDTHPGGGQLGAPAEEEEEAAEEECVRLVPSEPGLWYRRAWQPQPG